MARFSLSGREVGLDGKDPFEQRGVQLVGLRSPEESGEVV